jgi:hypothetical protein
LDDYGKALVTIGEQMKGNQEEKHLALVGWFDKYRSVLTKANHHEKIWK